MTTQLELHFRKKDFFHKSLLRKVSKNDFKYKSTTY